MGARLLSLCPQALGSELSREKVRGPKMSTHALEQGSANFSYRGSET